jgi:hypothetical protein
MKSLIFFITISMPFYLFSQNLVSINPSSASKGQTLNVTITGNNTHFSQGSGTLVYFDQGSSTIIVNSSNATTTNTIQANITVGQSTLTGSHDVCVYNNVDGILKLNLGFYVGPSSVSDNNQNNASFVVSPNPAKNYTTVIAKASNLNNSFISVYNLKGNLLIHQALRQEQTKIDISKLAKGSYLIKMTFNDKTEVLKLFKD